MLIFFFGFGDGAVSDPMVMVAWWYQILGRS